MIGAGIVIALVSFRQTDNDRSVALALREGRLVEARQGPSRLWLPPGLISVLSHTIVLAADGRAAYQGPVARAAAWFGVQGFEKRADFSHKTPNDLVPLYAEFSTGDLLVHGTRPCLDEMR